MKWNLKQRGGLVAFIAGLLCATALLSSALKAQTVSFAGMQSTVATGFNVPGSVAVDKAGNLYVADTYDSQLVKVAPGGAYSTVGTGLAYPGEVVIDGAGDIFVTSGANAPIQVIEIPANGGAQSVVPVSGISFPGIAVDTAGDLFITDIVDNLVAELPRTSSGWGTQITLPVTGLNGPDLDAVDLAGDLFVMDQTKGRIVELPAGGGAQLSIPLSGVLTPGGLAVDSEQNLYVTDQFNENVTVIPWNGSSYGQQFYLPSQGLDLPQGLTVNATDAVFIADALNGRIVEIQPANVNFGQVNVCAAGQSSPAPCSGALTLNYNVTTSGTLGTPKVLTAGSANLDFTLASGNTCIGSVTSGSSCSVNVTFTPSFAGPRRGAVEVTDANGNVLATTYVFGTAVGPQIAFGPGVQSTVYTPNGTANQVATDANGNLFIADTFGNRILKIAANGTQTVLASYLNGPKGVAVDGAGNVFFTAGSVFEISPSGSITTVSNNFGLPDALAVDGSGNLYVTDTERKKVTEIEAGGNQITLGSGWSVPTGIAVDAAGDVFVADAANEQVVELPAGGGAQTTLANGLLAANSVAVDAAGDVFIADTGHDRVQEVLAGGPQITVGDWSSPGAVAVDQMGNIFLTTADPKVIEIQDSLPPSLSFAATAYNSTSSDSPQFVTVQNIGNSQLNITALSVAANFAQIPGSGSPEDCSSSTSLNAGAECNLSLSFTPEAVGSIQGSVVLTDNALNGNPATQSVQLSGTGLAATQTISFSGLPSSATYGSAGPYTLSATASSGLPVSYSVIGPASISGTTLTITGAGTVVVTASQAGNGDYNAATPVSQSIVVGQASQTITFNSIAAQTVGATLSLSASASSGLTVSFSSSTTTVCTVSGTTATMLAPGTCTIAASQAGNTNYAAATTVTQSFTVSSATSFTITADPGSETIKRGVLAAFLLDVQSVNGFSGKVKLTCSGGPKGAECADLPQTVQVNANKTAYAVSGILFPASTAPGTYTITFTGTSGSLTETGTATFTVEK